MKSLMNVDVGNNNNLKKNIGLGKNNYLEIIFFLCGIYGILYFFERLPGVAFHGLAICLWILAFVCGLWYFVIIKSGRNITVTLSIIFITLVLTGIIAGGELLRQAKYLAKVLLSETGNEPQDLTLIFLIGLTLIAFLMFIVGFVWKKHMAAALIAVLMLLLGPLFGIPSSNKAVFFMSIFLISYFMADKKRNAGIAAVIIYALVFIWVSYNQEMMFESAYRAEHFIHNTVRWMTGMADETIADGNISRGNSYKTGTVQLEVTSYSMPTENLYLHGFSGNRYTGGKWTRANDTELLERTAEKLGLKQRSYSISTRYSGMYYTLNSFLSDEGIKNSRSVTIKHVSGHYRNYFEPYGGQWIDGALYNNPTYQGYEYRYYEQSDMMLDWSRAWGAFKSQAEWYRNLQAAYMEEVEETFLEVPKERLPRLTELCETNSLTDFDEITAFIAATLERRTTYTQLPGNAPMNKDIVEYFLFDSGKGYCQHYASVAALMYRMYGIPSRYVSGYMIQPSDFHIEKGVYKAYATDEAAHSWVEVFIKDYGWVPIDLTPSQSGNIQPVYPGFDATQWEQVLGKYRWDLDMEWNTGTDSDISQDEETQIVEEVWDLSQIEWEDYKELILVLATVFIYTIALIPFFIHYSRLRFWARFNTMNCQEIFDIMIKRLHKAGYLRDYDGMEADFTTKLTELFPEVDAADIVRMMGIIEKAAYGRPDAVGAMEEAFVRTVYLRLSRAVHDRIKVKKIKPKINLKKIQK